MPSSDCQRARKAKYGRYRSRGLACEGTKSREEEITQDGIARRESIRLMGDDTGAWRRREEEQKQQKRTENRGRSMQITKGEAK